MKKIFYKIIYFILKGYLIKRENEIELAIKNNKTVNIDLSLFVFKLIYLCLDTLQTQNSWCIFLVDNCATVFSLMNPNIIFELNSSFTITKKSFGFIGSATLFYPEKLSKKPFVLFLLMELWEYKIGVILIFIFSIILFFNTDISLIEKISNVNITIITLFISIYLFFLTTHINKTKSDISEFISGQFDRFYENSKNILYISFVSLSLSVFDIVLVNIKSSNLSKTIGYFLTEKKLISYVNRYSITLVIAIICIVMTFLCLFNILGYYMRTNKYKFYDECSKKIIDDARSASQELKELNRN